MNRSAAIVAVLALAGCREHEVPPDARGAAAGMPAVSATTRTLYPSAPGSFVDLVASARHGVVAIHAAQPVKSGPAAMFPGTPEQTADVSLGTGFLIDAKGIFVVTNDHIAAATTDLRVVLPDGTDVAAKLVGRDTELDIALLSVEATKQKTLPLGNSDDLQVGEWLVALGNPFGDEVSASVGVVSATGREGAGSLATSRALGFRTFIQTDAHIHRGNSGGPVLDTAGQVVGIAIATGDRAGELGFVIPINRLREVIDTLRDNGQVARSYLGCVVRPVTPELAQSVALPAPTGALVTEVYAGSPGARAGIRPGDIILKWGDRNVDHSSLPWTVAASPIGQAVVVTLWREHGEAKATVVTEKWRK